MKRFRKGALAAASLIAMAATAPEPPRFAAVQAAEGRAAYAVRCASCHGTRMEGGSGPALTGDAFRRKWMDTARPLSELYHIVSRQMPLGMPGTLSDEDNLAITAHILAGSGFVPGDVRLAADAMGGTLAPPAEAAAAARAERPPLLAAPVSPRQPSAGGPGDADLLHVADADWLTYNRDLSGRRFSPLAEITPGNAGNLQPVCILQLGETGVFQSGPVVHAGIMYVTTPHYTVALDARTCREKWRHSYVPEGPEPYTSNRGLALYDGRLFRGTADGHLLALDAANGALLWDVRVADSDAGQWISAAPLAIDGRVFIGNAGGIFGANGHIHAFDVATGKRLWTFDLIPQGKQPGAESWKAGAETGGGSSWSSFAYDPARRILYAPVGNPAPVFDGRPRAGDNLYTSSVVGLQAATGKLSAQYQQTPHDTHDYDTAAAPVLFEQDGRSLMAVANKGSWLFLYDRQANKLLTRQPLGRHENHDTEPTETPMRMCPGGAGGVEWNGPAYSPQTRRLYVNVVDWCMTVTRKAAPYVRGGFFYSAEFAFDPAETAFGTLRALDAATGAPAWTYRSDTPMLAGVTATAGGLIFTGDLQGYFLALDARKGELLYRFNTGGPIAGGVVTYGVDGRQYVAVASGNASKTWNSIGAATIVVFALPSR